MSFRRLGEPFNKLGSVLGQAARNMGPLFPIIINFDGDESEFFDGGWAEAGDNVTNDKLSLGSELLTNGDFSAWTADDPDGWTVSGESGSDPEVSEVGPGESHGGLGTGLANLFSSATAGQPRIAQTVLTTTDWYQWKLDVDTIVAGTISMLDAAGILQVVYTTTGSKIATGLPGNAGFQARTTGPPSDATVDNVSVKQLTLTSMFNQLKDRFGIADGFFIDVYINTVTVDTQIGVIWNYDGSNNFGMAYLDGNGNRLRVNKNVAGTYTNLANVAQILTPDQILRIENPTGSNVLDILYNGVSKATPTISDAGIISNTGIALFSTEANNAISKVEIGLL